jgi:hypothetical protein
MLPGVRVGVKAVREHNRRCTELHNEVGHVHSVEHQPTRRELNALSSR